MTDFGLNAKTFDIADMFAGVSFPQETVSVYTDAGIAYEYNKLISDAQEAVNEQDDSKASAVAERQKELTERAEKYRYEFHLRGQSVENQKAVRTAVRAKHPATYNFLNQEEPNPQADEMHANMMWALFIERIVAPTGAMIVAPSEADVRVLRGQLPESEQSKIEKAILNLSEGAKSGFEALAQDHDFLSSASPEA